MFAASACQARIEVNTSTELSIWHVCLSSVLVESKGELKQADQRSAQHSRASLMSLSHFQCVHVVFLSFSYSIHSCALLLVCGLDGERGWMDPFCRTPEPSFLERPRWRHLHTLGRHARALQRRTCLTEWRQQQRTRWAYTWIYIQCADKHIQYTLTDMLFNT